MFGQLNTTKKLIIQIISRENISSTDLQKRISQERNITKQAFYKTLRELIKDEIIIKNKKKLTLNNVWIEKIYEFLSSINQPHHTNNENIFNLKGNQKIIYYFNSLTSLNQFWMHYFLTLTKTANKKPIIIYNKHNFWMLFRGESENFMFKWLIQNKKEIYFVIGEDTILDRETTQYVKNFSIATHYEKKPIFKNNPYSVIVTGDYVVTTTIHKDVAIQIDNIYQKFKTWNEDSAQILSKIIESKKSAKIVITHNPKKAESIRKKLMNYFIFY